jgi:hypothetical protein
MLQILGLSVAMLLFGTDVWANFGGGSLSQVADRMEVAMPIVR